MLLIWLIKRRKLDFLRSWLPLNVLAPFSLFTVAASAKQHDVAAVKDSSSVGEDEPSYHIRKAAESVEMCLHAAKGLHGGFHAVCLTRRSASGNHVEARKLRAVLARLYAAMEISTSTDLSSSMRTVESWAEEQSYAADADSDSFLSIVDEDEETLLPSLEEDSADQEQCIYASALKLAESGMVPCRKNRTVETGCTNMSDFLARLHCIRMASTVG